MEQQKLITKMQNMFKSIRTDDEKDRYFHFTSKYNPKVKITDWFLPLEADPKDRDPYHPPGGDYFLSTYRRLGADDVTPLETTTQAMLRQICNPPESPSPYRPMVNAATRDIIQPRQEDLFELEGPACNENNFQTTYNYDYRHPFPYRRATIYKSEDKPQKRFGLVSQFNKSKICETKFLDDELLDKTTKNSSNVLR